MRHLFLKVFLRVLHLELFSRYSLGFRLFYINSLVSELSRLEFSLSVVYQNYISFCPFFPPFLCPKSEWFRHVSQVTVAWDSSNQGKNTKRKENIQSMWQAMSVRPCCLTCSHCVSVDYLIRVSRLLVVRVLEGDFLSWESMSYRHVRQWGNVETLSWLANWIKLHMLCS